MSTAISDRMRDHAITSHEEYAEPRARFLREHGEPSHLHTCSFLGTPPMTVCGAKDISERVSTSCAQMIREHAGLFEDVPLCGDCVRGAFVVGSPHARTGNDRG